MDESENMHITTANVLKIQSNNKKLLRKTGKVKPEEVSTPTHFEHLVHIEDLQSNANNFVVTELSHDPIIRNIFNMIEKNIAHTDRDAITVITPTDNMTELCLESIKKNQENTTENVTVCIHDVETYDNFNNHTIPFYITNEKQSVQQRNNSKLNLKCNQKVSDDKKDQSIPHNLASNYGEKDNQKSTENFLILPKRHTKLTSISSSDSTEATSPLTPSTPISISFQYPDLKKQEAAYDALISGNTEKVVSENLYENQEEAIIVNSMQAGTNNFEMKFTDYDDQMEIQQALKQLDDALDEQIFIETSQTLNPEKSNMMIFDEGSECTRSIDSKKSVKQLVEMLDSKQLQFNKCNMLPKLHPTLINQDCNFTPDSKSNTKTKKTSLYISDPETSSKPSLIGVNIFGLNNGKSIAEIIAEKRNHKNHSIHKPSPTSPKPFLKKPLPIPKLNNSNEDEQQELLRQSSLTQTIHSSEQLIFDNRKENMIFTTDKKPKIQTKLQKISNSEMLSTIIKVDDSESSINFQSTLTNTANSFSVPSTIIDNAIGKDLNQQCLPKIQHIARNHIYENLNQNDNEKYLETSFDGPIAMTVISESKNGTTKNLAYICDNDNVISVRKDASHISHQQQQQQQEDSVTDKGKHFVDNIPTIISISSNDACNYAHNVKWRNDSMKRANFDVPLENERNSEPISPQQTCFKRNSYGSVSDKRIMQRSTSLYYTSSNNESSDIVMNYDSDNVRQHSSIINRSSSLSIPETARIPVRPVPAPRQNHCMKGMTITVDMPQIENTNFRKELKRPVPIPRQSKLKIALNDDLLKKGSFSVTKIQHGIVNCPESMITIAKAVKKVSEEESDRSEWMLRL
ncbi:hypothetical protein ACH3XW_1900 [Acanthocheilonema viteae]